MLQAVPGRSLERFRELKEVSGNVSEDSGSFRSI